AALTVAYLLWSNLFTYFFYHVWQSRAQANTDWQRRRFVSLAQSICFNILGFAYIYRFFLKDEFVWKFADSALFYKDAILSLIFSSMNLFGGGSTVAEPQTILGLAAVASQAMSTFIFLTLILANTQINKETT
ncbi:MAG: hypothetical protein ACLGGX_12740, partial [Bdellovibrionia bacterium]